MPTEVDELGIGSAGFPLDEEISAVDVVATLPTCPSTDSGALNTVVQMTNLTAFDFLEVWYVADPDRPDAPSRV